MNAKFVAMETTYEKAQKKLSANIAKECCGYMEVLTMIEIYRVRGKCKLKMTILVHQQHVLL